MIGLKKISLILLFYLWVGLLKFYIIGQKKNMSAGKFNQVIEEGSKLECSNFIWYQNDNETDPVDLTGMTARAEFKANIKSFEPYLVLSTADNTIILGDEDGTIDLLPTDEQLEDIKINGGVWQLEIYSGAVPYRLLEGSVLRSSELIK